MDTQRGIMGEENKNVTKSYFWFGDHYQYRLQFITKIWLFIALLVSNNWQVHAGSITVYSNSDNCATFAQTGTEAQFCLKVTGTRVNIPNPALNFVSCQGTVLYKHNGVVQEFDKMFSIPNSDCQCSTKHPTTPNMAIQCDKIVQEWGCVNGQPVVSLSLWWKCLGCTTLVTSNLPATLPFQASPILENYYKFSSGLGAGYCSITPSLPPVTLKPTISPTKDYVYEDSNNCESFPTNGKEAQICLKMKHVRTNLPNPQPNFITCPGWILWKHNQQVQQYEYNFNIPIQQHCSCSRNVATDCSKIVQRWTCVAGAPAVSLSLWWSCLGCTSLSTSVGSTPFFTFSAFPAVKNYYSFHTWLSPAFCGLNSDIPLLTPKPTIRPSSRAPTRSRRPTKAPSHPPPPPAPPTLKISSLSIDYPHCSAIGCCSSGKVTFAYAWTTPSQLLTNFKKTIVQQIINDVEAQLEECGACVLGEELVADIATCISCAGLCCLPAIEADLSATLPLIWSCMVANSFGLANLASEIATDFFSTLCSSVQVGYFDSWSSQKCVIGSFKAGCTPTFRSLADFIDCKNANHGLTCLGTRRRELQWIDVKSIDSPDSQKRRELLSDSCPTNPPF